MGYRPDDPNIRVQDGMLEILVAPKQPKLGMDTDTNWFCCLKYIPTYPNRVYNEMATLTISIWYYRDKVCELEPIGPVERISSGRSVSFTEEWRLIPYKFPDQRTEVNLKKVKQEVNLELKKR